MKFLFDLFPVILFFTAYKFAGIFAATAVAIVATVLQIVWVRVRHGKVDLMLWVSLVLVSVFGGATLLLRDETFIKWKPTVLYWIFSTVLVVSAVGFNKNLMRSMLGQQLTLPDAVWGRLNAAWAAFFAIMGALNLFVAFRFPTDIWVDFKLFGGMGLMFAFVIIQGLMLSKYVEQAPKENP